MTENYFSSMKLAGDILEKRTKDDVSFRQLSDLIGIDKSSLYRMECGDQFLPKLNDFFLVCKWLGRPMEMYFITPKIKTDGKKNISGTTAGGKKTPKGKR